jgi:hypothetical protein
LSRVTYKALSGGDGLIAQALAATEQAEAEMESDHGPRTKTSILNAGRQAAVKNIIPEWKEEFGLRDLYDIDPPAPIAEDAGELYDPNNSFALPSPSSLNGNSQRQYKRSSSKLIRPVSPSHRFLCHCTATTH